MRDPDPDQELVDLTTELDQARAELVEFDTDPRYRARLLADIRAEHLYELGRLSWQRYLLIAARPGADPGGPVAALDDAMAALSTARAALPGGTGLAVDLALWLRFGWLERYLANADPAALDQMVELGAEIVAADGLEPEDRAEVRYWLAESLLERHSLTADPADLDRAIIEAELAIDHGPPDPPGPADDPEHAGGADDADDPENADPEHAGGADDDALGWWPLAVLSAGRSRSQRWTLARRRDDLDAAIAHLDLLADPTDGSPAFDLVPAALGDLAQLHQDRAALRTEESAGDAARKPVDGAAREPIGSAAGEPVDSGGTTESVNGAAIEADLAASRRLLDTALARCAADDPARPKLLATRGLLGWGRYQHSRRVEELDQVERELAEALDAFAEGSDGREVLVTMQGVLVAERMSRGLPERPADRAAVNQTFARIQQDLQEAAREGNPFQQPWADPTVSPWVQGLFSAQRGVENLDRAIEAWAAMPQTHPDRAATAGALASAELMAQQHGYRDLDHRRTIEMLTVARTARPDDPQWQQRMLTLLGMVGTLGAQHGDVALLEPALEALASARRIPSTDGPVLAELDMLIAVAKQLRAHQQGNLGGMAEMVADHADIAGRTDLTEQQRLLLSLQDAGIRAQHAFQQRDPAALDVALAQLRAGLVQLPEGDIRRGPVIANLAAAEVWQSSLAGDRPDLDAMRRAADLMAEAAAQPGVGAWGGAEMTDLSVLLRAGLAVADRDEAALARQIDVLHRRLSELPADQSTALALRIQLAGIYLMRLEAWRTFDDADRAIAELELVRPHVDPTHLMWSAEMSWLSRAYRSRDDRARGDRASSRAAGLQALRGYAWRTLVQSDARTAALAGGRSVAEDATEVASWCVLDNEPAQAVQALDACRGLVLQAASRTRDVPALLTAAGQSELAAQWRGHTDSGGQLPDALRQRVMRALLTHEQSAHEQGAHEQAAQTTRIELLDPPEPADIAGALRAAGCDALVYLVPQSEEQPRPVAVLVPARGDPEILPLSLQAARFTALDGYLATRFPDRGRGARDAAPIDLADVTTAGEWQAAGEWQGGDEGQRALRELSDWAWYAAMDRLFQYCVQHGLSRPYRLVLVPMGAFGLVPWHAARIPGGGYVIQDAVLSYAASARMFCATMARDRIAVGADSLIVGNPTEDLSHAGAEAVAIRDTFYRTAPYLGRRDDGRSVGRGTPGQVLEWLRATLGADRGVLHLACHGVVVPDGPERSYLLLAGPHGPAQLTAERLIDEARRSPGGFRLGAVVLAACSSGVPGRTYDEAFSLATVFLMAGARAVIGSLWPVPDGATSLLMYMLHHYLVRDRLGTAQALRLAQLWMLDPDRTAPDGMPPALADLVSEIDPTELAGWAGFSHLGQW